MASKLNVHKVALTFSVFFAVLHPVGVLLLLLTRDVVISWALAVHFISIPITLAPFSWSYFVGGIVTAFVVGGIVGGFFAVVWNWAMRK